MPHSVLGLKAQKDQFGLSGADLCTRITKSKWSLAEKQLPRETRAKLAQLRSGFSKLLNSYLSRVDPVVRDECPLCQESPHNTSHLFNCSENPTNLTPVDLWNSPIKVAEFLNLPTSLDFGDDC
ncbi:hypothetical protein M8J77_026043 [Diaphorina citri]|nr:hypothetical protein M8J77_026043 [Diaphorina citri]